MKKYHFVQEFHYSVPEKSLKLPVYIFVVLALIYWIQFNLNGWLSQQSDYRLLASQMNLEDKAQTFFLGGR